jgi:polar amino acid transport system substrate-binding protein
MWPRQETTMRMVGLSVALLATVLTIDGAHADDASAKAALAGGKLWVGIVVGPTPGPGRVVGPAGPGRGPGIVRDGLHGVEVDLGTSLAEKLGTSVEFMAYSDSDSLTLTAAVSEWSIAFIPVEEENRQYVDFGSAYIMLQATYLVRPGSLIKRLADVDKPSVRVATAIDEPATARAAARSLKKATVTARVTSDELLELLTSKKVDAVALSREAAAALSARLPGSRVLDGAFWKSYVAIAVPAVKGHPAVVIPSTQDPAVLPYLNAFIDEAIASRQSASFPRQRWHAELYRSAARNAAVAHEVRWCSRANALT